MLKVTLTTVAEFYNDDSNTINHHGFKRKVMEEEKVKIHHNTAIICMRADLFIFILIFKNIIPGWNK